MAVTVNTNTLSSGWTQAQFMTALETCFVNSGELSSAWYDSVVSGANAYGILRRTYDAGTYGTTDYGFRLEGTSNLRLVAFREWNTGTSTPTGLAGRDYPEDWNQGDASDFGDVALQQQSGDLPSFQSSGVFNLSNSFSVTFTSFTSAVPGRSTFRWYLIENAGSSFNFQIPNEPCIYNNSESQCFAQVYAAHPLKNNTYKRGITFTAMSWGFDRTYPGGMIRGQDVNVTEGDNQYMTMGMQHYFTLYVLSSVNFNGNSSFKTQGGIHMPITGNWGYNITDEFEPVLMGGPYTSNHEIMTLPNDFGVWAGSIGANTLAVNDILQVSASEEYRVIACVNDNTTTNARYVAAFVARTT
jgi:hypothetical protein